MRAVPLEGSRVVVVGRLQQRTWTAGDGSTRQLVEVVADELGPATALGNDDHDQGEEKPGTVAT
jgi:single-stranded DNA-binding protein